MPNDRIYNNITYIVPDRDGAKAGYALHDEERLRCMEAGIPSTRVIKVDISLSDTICQVDIAFLRRHGRALDVPDVARFLHVKAPARSVHVSREAFRSREVLDRAHSDYAALAQAMRGHFQP